MDNPKIITFSARDSKGNVHVSVGNANQFQDHRQYSLDTLKLVQERTYALIMKGTMTKNESVAMLEFAESLDDAIAMLDDNPL